MKFVNKFKHVFFFSMLMVMLLPASKVFAWGSNESDELDTHKMIMQQGLVTLQNDFVESENASLQSNLNILSQKMNTLKKGSVYPDFDSNGYKLYQDHFYDPYTKENYTREWWSPSPYIPENAETQTRRYMNEAVYLWKQGNHESAAFKIGCAMHYFADVSNPHHASNIIASPTSAHAPFETYVDDNVNKFMINGSGYTTSSNFYKQGLDQSFDKIITSLVDEHAFRAYPYGEKLTLTNKSEWFSIAKDRTADGQRGVARVLYAFLNEVSEENTPVNPELPIGKFNIVIGTDDVKFAGTDDYVYFGMELNNGRVIEFNCDLPGNDFERNTTWSYEFEINDTTVNPKEVKRVWLRKKNYIPFGGDDWKVKDLAVYMKGKNVLYKNINSWMDGNATYDINVNGLNY